MPTKSPLPVLANKAPAPETSRSGESTVDGLSSQDPLAPSVLSRKLGIDPRLMTVPDSSESQSGQVNGSASGRHNVGPDLLQRYGVSLGGLDGEERRNGNSEKYKR